MSILSPYQTDPYGRVEDTQAAVSTPRASVSPQPRTMTLPGTSMVWQNGVPVVQMQDAVVETVVTHTTRTTTSFAPIPLPRIPVPEDIPLPSHLSPKLYPLAFEPTPEDMQLFAITIGDQRMMVRDSNEPTSSSRLLEPDSSRGWKKNESIGPCISRTVNLAEALNVGKGKDRKRVYDSEVALPSMAVPTPPVSVNSKIIRTDSPPRKRLRRKDEVISIDAETSLLSPLPSPEHDAPVPLPPTAREPAHTPKVGSGLEMAALFSLPSLVSQFENLPDKLQQHVLMHLFRRARMPTLQQISAFASPALKRDFISVLPHEVALQILRRMDATSLGAATRVSKKWKRMVDSERSIWEQRLIEDNLWTGHGTEEEEEALVTQRLKTVRWSLAQDNLSQGIPPDPPPPADMSDPPVPLKHVYRRRRTAKKRWLETEPTHYQFPGHGTAVVTCIQFDDEKLVTASDDHSINVYNMRTGQLTKRLDGHEGGVWALEYLGDILVTGSTDRTVRIWDLQTFQLLQVFYGHTSTVRCLQIVQPVLDKATGEYQPPYPMIVTGSRDASLRVWKLPRKGEPSLRCWNEEGVEKQLQPAENPYHLHHLETHTQAVRAIATYGRLCMSGSYDYTVRIWDIVKGTCLHVLSGHTNKVYSIVYDRYRHRCASGSMDNTVKIWDVATGECLHTLSGHTQLVGLLEISPNYIVSAAADASLRIWDANTYELKNVLSAHVGAITCFAHDELKVVSGSDGSLKLWDIETGRNIRDLVVGINSVWQVVFKNDMLVAAVNRNGATVFVVFDFSRDDPGHPSGIDDDWIDTIRRPAWERDNPREPLSYQSDGDYKFDYLFGVPKTAAGVYGLASLRSGADAIDANPWIRRTARIRRRDQPDYEEVDGLPRRWRKDDPPVAESSSTRRSSRIASRTEAQARDGATPAAAPSNSASTSAEPLGSASGPSAVTNPSPTTHEQTRTTRSRPNLSLETGFTADERARTLGAYTSEASASESTSGLAAASASENADTSIRRSARKSAKVAGKSRAEPGSPTPVRRVTRSGRVDMLQSTAHTSIDESFLPDSSSEEEGVPSVGGRHERELGVSDHAIGYEPRAVVGKGKARDVVVVGDEEEDEDQGGGDGEIQTHPLASNRRSTSWPAEEEGDYDIEDYEEMTGGSVMDHAVQSGEDDEEGVQWSSDVD